MMRRRVAGSPTGVVGEDPNPNTSWVHSTRFQASYIVACGVFWSIFYFSTVRSDYAWTLTNVLHSLVTFSWLHWLKGAPFSNIFMDDRIAELTFWEQIDEQRQNTPTRKFFEIAPCVLLVITMLYTQEDLVQLFINFLAFAFIIVPKMPCLHRIRLFGINSD